MLSVWLIMYVRPEINLFFKMRPSAKFEMHLKVLAYSAYNSEL